MSALFLSVILESVRRRHPHAGVCAIVGEVGPGALGLRGEAGEQVVAVDWLAIKTEYISTRISLRKLAEKYGVSFSTIGKKAMNEKWNDERIDTGNKMETKAKQKIVSAVATQEADRIVRILSAGDKLLSRLEEATDQLDRTLAKHKRKTRTIEYEDAGAKGKPTREVTVEEEVLEVAPAPIDRQGVRLLAGALKDLLDVAKIGNTDDTTISKLDELIKELDNEAAKP